MMKSWNQYTDKDRMEFAQGEYTKQNVGDFYYVGEGDNQKAAGYVRERVGFDKDGNPIANHAGEQAYIVSQEDLSVPKDQVKHVAVVYQGSDGDFVNNPGDAASDWAVNDFFQAIGSLYNDKFNPIRPRFTSIPVETPQFWASADTLNRVAKEYPNAEIDVYGQSLASMDGQFACASLDDPSRLHGAWLYEGPNIYPNLDPTRKAKADKVKGKIHNYVDRKDIVPLGYNGQKTVGEVTFVNSEGYYGIVGQHMWGGYYFDANGKLMPNGIAEGLKDEFEDISDKYQEFSQGNLSSADKIMLDAGTARNILRALSNAIENEYTIIKQLYQDASDKCDSLWEDSKSRAASLGTHLSIQESKDALKAGGCYKGKYDAVADHFKSKMHQFKALESKIDGWIKKLDEAISKIQGADEKIAGYFN